MNQMSLFEVMSKLKFSDFISIIALVISGISIFWNIYRDIILKAALRVRIQISEIVYQERHLGTFIDVTGVNHGPGSITCEGVFIKNSLWEQLRGKKKYGYVIPDYMNPITEKLPKKLEVGEKVILLFPYNRDAFLSHNLSHVGIKDSFGRLHWATRKSLKQAVEQFSKDFLGKGPNTEQSKGERR